MIKASQCIDKTGIRFDPRTRIIIIPLIGFAAFGIQQEVNFYIAVSYTAFLLVLSN